MTAGRASFWQNRVVPTLMAIVVAIGIGGLIIWGFLEGRGEAEREAERERPVKAPLRVSTKNGMTVVTLDNETQRNSGVETTTLASAPYQEQVRAYGCRYWPPRSATMTPRANATSRSQTGPARAFSR